MTKLVGRIHPLGATAICATFNGNKESSGATLKTHWQ